ncbi:MAG: cysteine desulfurase-like protein [Gemmatimonadetes bacterium]|nr:cysteine desulfurase-like protein [Gemmatimonadota bacterium]
MAEGTGAGAPGLAAVETIRAQFPALARQHNGRSVAYFDGPGGTQVPHAVTQAMTDYLLQHNANTAWAYPTSEETDAALWRARQALADFLGATPAEIAFGCNMTTLTFHLSRALGRRLNAGDEVVATELEHHANIAPWQALVRERGVRLRLARMRPETGELDWEHLERQISPRTRLLALTAASNALGTIVQVPRAAALARQVGALVFVDAVHLAAHAPLAVRELDCDFLACSAYKFYGPHVGVLYARRELLEELDLPRLEPAPDTAPERFETGTQNHEGIVGAAAAVDFLASLAPGANRRARLRATLEQLGGRGDALLRRLWDGLGEIRGVRRYGPPPGTPRTPTLAFTVDGLAAIEVVRHLAEQALFATHGDFYAATVLERLGLSAQGLVRAGCACYTTGGEVERLLQAVAELTG